MFLPLEMIMPSLLVTCSMDVSAIGVRLAGQSWLLLLERLVHAWLSCAQPERVADDCWNALGFMIHERYWCCFGAVT